MYNIAFKQFLNNSMPSWWVNFDLTPFTSRHLSQNLRASRIVQAIGSSVAKRRTRLGEALDGPGVRKLTVRSRSEYFGGMHLFPGIQASLRLLLKRRGGVGITGKLARYMYHVGTQASDGLFAMTRRMLTAACAYSCATWERVPCVFLAVLDSKVHFPL